MTDPFLAAAREALERSFADMRQAVQGLPAEALNWRPGGEDTNSIAVLATHALHSTRSWLSAAVGEPRPERDRPSEFRAEAADAATLLAFVDEMAAGCLALVDPAREVAWSARRGPYARFRAGAPTHVAAAWALLHSLEHLREHVAHITLTRQLWEQRQR